MLYLLYDKYNNLELIVRTGLKRNLADSINDGITLARYENIIWLDADFQHPPKYIESFIQEIESYDVVIASRFLPRSDRYFKKDEISKDVNENQSYFYNKLCNFFLYKDLTDFTSGFICLKKFYFENFRIQFVFGLQFLYRTNDTSRRYICF